MKQRVNDPKRIPVLRQRMSCFYTLTAFAVGTIDEHPDWKTVLLVATSFEIVSFLQLADEVLKSAGSWLRMAAQQTRHLRSFFP